MTLSPRVRRASLTLHVFASVGWAGAVFMYLALGIAAVTSDDEGLVSAAYVTMDWAGCRVLVPFAVASLLTGITHALITPWGLMQHYWVIVKLALTVLATVVLVAYTRTLSAFAEVAARNPLRASDLDYLQNPSVILHSTAALVLLFVVTVLAVYKPVGMTRRGQRLRHQSRRASPTPPAQTSE